MEDESTLQRREEVGTMGCERDYGKGGMVDEKSGAEERGSAPLLQVHQEGGKRGGEGGVGGGSRPGP